MVDISAPSAPSLTISESSPLSHVSGTTLYYNAQGANSASFTVEAASSDDQSGIQKLAFPTVTGMTGGGDDTSSPYSTTYSWDDTTAAGGDWTVTAVNGAGTTATETFSVARDTTAPAGYSVDLPAVRGTRRSASRSRSTPAPTPAQASTEARSSSSATRRPSPTAPAVPSAARGRR